MLLVAAIFSFSLPINMGFAQALVTIPTQVISAPVAPISGFGQAVEVDGLRAIVEEGDGVYIYEFSNNRWNLTTDLFSSLPNRSRAFTGSVALDGNTAAVQYGIIGSLPTLGVFEFINGDWLQTATITLPSSAFATNSTNPLAVSGNTIVIGVSDFDGKAHVYEKIDNVWTFVIELSSPEVETDLPPVFARDVDVNNDTIVIRQTSIGIGIDRGINAALFIYKKVDGTWFQESRLPLIRGNNLEVGENNLGATHKAVSLSDNRLIVAVRAGAIVFDLINGNWTEVGFFGPSNLAIGQFGLDESVATVSLDSTGTQAVLGSSQGRAFLFQYFNGDWAETELSASNNPSRFGESVGIDGEHIMVGSRGAVYYYRLNQSSPCIDTDGDGFGWNGTNTCTPTSTISGDNQPQPLQCIDTDGDGFGWNGFETCLPDGGESQPVIDQSLACIDTDGDGFGWNGFETCLPDGGESQPVVDQSLACIDTDGDGFGWNGVETCIPDGGDSRPVVVQSLVCIDSDGDGFGWTGTQSCRFDAQGNIVIL